jgi:hypothetical protein
MNFRKAVREDVPFIVEMLANDTLGKLREDFQDPLPEKYFSAFEKVSEDANQELIVVENDQGERIATLQISFIQYLTYQGGIRAQIEAVRAKEDQRDMGTGEKVFSWAVNRAKQKGAHMVQLTTDKKGRMPCDFMRN